MKIVLDSHIPYGPEYFAGLGTVVSVPGHDIGPETVKNADALIIRSVTKVDSTLLYASNVSFVGSATAGLDHVDMRYLSSRGIRLASAPGANANAVVDYVLAVLALGAAFTGKTLPGKMLGIVGVGHVGSRLDVRARALGMKTLLCDPPRQEAGDKGPWVSIDEIVAASDVVSLHTPLVRTGAHPTWCLLDESRIRALGPGAWVIQSSRGGVADEGALTDARWKGRLGFLALDVWETEPRPFVGSIRKADLSTPHIAGYTIEAKRNSVQMVRDALYRHLGRLIPPEKKKSICEQKVDLRDADMQTPLGLSTLVNQMSDFETDHANMKISMTGEASDAGKFHEMRAYAATNRHAFSCFRLMGSVKDPESRRMLTHGLGIRID